MSTTSPTTRRRTTASRSSAAGGATTTNRTIAPVGSGLDGNGGYQLPVLGTRLPAGLVEKGFWGALVGSAILGAVDPPLAALVGAGVLVARHRRG